MEPSAQRAPRPANLTRAHFAAALISIALAIAMTWPLAFALDRAVANSSDPLLNAWIVDWDWYATLHHPSHLFDANAFYPGKDSLAFSENLYGIALVVFPLRAIGVAPLTAFNIAMLLGFAFSMFGAYLLGRTISGCWIAAIAAGIFYAYVPWRFTQLPHIQHVWGGWLPMLLVALIHYARIPSWRRAALFGGAFLMNGLTNIHWLLLGSFAVALSVPIAIRSPRQWMRIGVCTLIALALLAPFLIPYARAAKLYGMERHPDEAAHYSATLRDWLNPGITNRFYRGIADTTADPELWIFPGFLGVALAIAGFTRGARDDRAIALLWIVLGVLGSLGLHTFFHRFLFDHVPGFRAIRVPARWANIAYVGMSMAIALGVSSIASKRRVAAYVVALLFLIELRASPIRWTTISPQTPEVYRWLSTQRTRVVEVPIGLEQLDYLFEYRSTAHHQPLVNGVSGFAPPETLKIADLWSSKRDDEFLDEMRRIGVHHLVVHADLLGDRGDEVRAWLRRQLDANQLQFVARFNASVSGDWVFALDGPPRPRSEALERYLDNQTTYSDDTIAMLDYPRYGEKVGGNALFSGWAMSPWGIREVHFLFDNGQVRVPATLSEDRGVSHGLPWYPKTPKPRFTARFERRPTFVRSDTDVQVEIIDGRGKKTVLDGRPIDWIR